MGAQVISTGAQAPVFRPVGNCKGYGGDGKGNGYGDGYGYGNGYGNGYGIVESGRQRRK